MNAAACLESGETDHLKCATASEGSYVDSTGLVTLCTSQSQCQTDGIGCLAADNVFLKVSECLVA